MRQRILTISLNLSVILFSLSVFAQNNDGTTSKHNEINISFDDIFAKFPYYYFDNTNMLLDNNNAQLMDALLNTPKVGLGYKYNFSNGAIRSKISFGTSNQTYDNSSSTSSDENPTKISFFDISGSLGYEFHINVEKTQLFTGADIFINYSKYCTTYQTTGQTGVYNPVTGNEDMVSYTNTNKDTDEHLGYGISPFIGIKYFISPMFSVSTEMKFFVEHYEDNSNTKYTTTNPNDNGMDNESNPGTKYTGLNTKFGPMGQISFNIHF